MVGSQQITCTTGLVLLTFFFGSPAIAQNSVCEALLQHGVRDTSITDFSQDRFLEIRAQSCNENYSTLEKASAQAQSGALDIPGYLGINASSSDANSEYNKKYSLLCSSDYNKAVADTTIHSFISTINAALLQSFDKCVENTQERFIRYVEPRAGGKVFSIVFRNNRLGNPSFTLRQLTIFDATTGASITPDALHCDLPKPLPIDTSPDNAMTILCFKPAADELVVSAQTSAGPIDPVTIPAVPPPPPGIEGKLADLEGKLEIIKATKIGQCRVCIYAWGSTPIGPDGKPMDPCKMVIPNGELCGPPSFATSTDAQYSPDVIIHSPSASYGCNIHVGLDCKP